MPNGHNGTPLLASGPAKTRPLLSTSEMTAAQRSARVDQLVVDVAELKAAVASLQRDYTALEARVVAIEGLMSEASTSGSLWQRLRWLVRG